MSLTRVGTPEHTLRIQRLYRKSIQFLMAHSTPFRVAKMYQDR